MKKLLLLLMAGFCSPVIHAQQQTADFTEASEICFPDSLSRIPGDSSDSLIYFTGGFVTPVHYAVNRDVPQPNDRLEPAFGLLDEIRHDPVYRLTFVWIGGSASPEGPAGWNRSLGQRRADALVRLIGDQTGLSEEWFRTDSLGEDWTSFERMLAASRHIPKRDEVLEILRSTPDNEARKRKISDLDSGQTWQQIIREFFPPLRNARMVIVYQRPKNDGIGAEAAFPAPLLRVAEQPLPAAGLPAAPERGCSCGKWLIAAKTNLLFDAALVANLGIEISPCTHWSLDIPVWYSPYNITSRRNIRLLAVQPEIRWWPEEALRGHFIGLHTHVAGFNIALDDYARYQDPNHALWGLGLSYGYALPLGRAQRWGLEFPLGAGFAKYRYDAYRNRENGQKFASGSDCYWGITRAGITLSYKWDLSRKNPKN